MFSSQVQRLFIDTGAFLAQRSASDQFHLEAIRGFKRIAESGVQVFSTEHVLDETLTILGRKESYAFAAATGKDLLNSKVLNWLRPHPDELLLAVELMRKYADQKVSFTDAISFVMMKRNKIRHVFGFDRHFSAAGFILVPAQ